MSKIQDFLVVGTTFKNEDGKEIQQILKKIKDENLKNGNFTPYKGLTDKEIMDLGLMIGEVSEQPIADVLIKEGLFDDELCYKVYLKLNNEFQHVGYISKKEQHKMKLIYKLNLKSICYLVGGIYKAQSFYDEKLKITEELNYGLRIVMY